MTLSPGQRLGPYEILAAAGAGGMGEVYKARDTRLDRVVAVKVLPSHFAVSPEMRQRFDREARAVSSLNHPHICALYDIGEQDGTDFLVMEYVEGETLESRLMRGALPAELTLRTATEIASALDAAHRKGIIHRDLKPGNIMLTKSGAKLLDFGLAKPTASLGPALSSLSVPPTETRALTAEGSIVGTFHYLSPEQLEEKEVDARTDLFALGLVIYEMVTARKAFEGKSRASVIAAILSSQPKPISEIQSMTPPALDRIVRRCLAKDPDDRWQSARDLMLELKWITEGGGPQSTTAQAISSPRKSWAPWIAAAATFIAGVALAVLVLPRGGSSGGASNRLVVDLVPQQVPHFSFDANDCGALSVSPDGRYLTFAGETPDGKHLLWLRPLDSAEAKPIAGTEGGTFPFWSPDNRSLAFFAAGKLKRIDIAGGPAVSLADASRGRNGGWSRDGVILFSPDTVSPIFRVAASGGSAKAVTKLDESKKETTHRWATFLPDGKHFLYMAGSHGTGTESELNAIYLAALDSDDRKLLLRARSNVLYASGYLLYTSGESLVAHPFDLGRLELTGDPVPLAEGVQYASGFFRAAFAASDNGLLAYHSSSSSVSSKLFWMDRSGNRTGPIGDLSNLVEFRLSPDGKRFAGTLFPPGGSGTDLWIYSLPDVAGGPFASIPVQDEGTPVWSPDGSRIAFQAGTKWSDLYVKSANGIGEAELLLKSEADMAPTSWSPDGRFLAYNLDDLKNRNNSDIWILPLFGDRKPFPFQATDANEFNAIFSPDGRWVLFGSDESGRNDVYLAPFPGPGGKLLVSRGGGGGASWNRNGREIIYVGSDGFVTSVPVTLGTTPELGKPLPLFKAADVVYGDALPDLSRFLVAVRPEDPSALPIRLIQNWMPPASK